MAVEAAYQTAMVTKWKHQAPPQYRFKLRDVKLLRALVLTEEVQTTISLALSPLRESSNGSWYEYRMCSEQEGVDVDTVHCTGMICVETGYTTASKVVEPLELSTSARQWYKIMADMGYNFGASFRKHLMVESTMGQLQSRSTIDLQPPPSQPEGQSWYPLHPAVLDGCFQATTPALWRGHLPQAGDPALIPKAIGSMIIESGSAHKLRKLAEGVAYASAQYLGAGNVDHARNYSTSVELHDPTDGSLLFKLQGLEWAEMETSDEEKIPHQFMNVRWDADIDLLMSKEQALSKAYLNTKTVQQIIDLVAHKSPSLSVLEVNLSTLDGSNLWMDESEAESNKSIRAASSQYHFAVRDPKTLIQAQEKFNSRSPHPQFHLVMDATKPASITGADSIDLAIVNPGQEDNGDLAQFLQGLALSIKDGGYLISQQLPQVESLGETIHLDSGVSICRVQRQPKSEISIEAVEEAPVRVVTRVSLLNTAAQDLISDSLAKLTTDLAAEKWTLSSSAQPLEDITSSTNVVVVLDEIFSSVMDNIDAEQWSLLKHLAAVQRPMLWVTNRNADPTRAAAVGFLATIRAEEQVPFFTLDVEANSGRATIDAIAACLDRVWNQTTANKFDPKISIDYDFVERGGVISVSRVYQDGDLTFNQSSHVSERKTELIDIHKSELLIQARCEKLGDLDSVHFGEIDAKVSALPNGMVEVEIHAAGIGYEDLASTCE
jgi:hypothetical protein